MKRVVVMIVPALSVMRKSFLELAKCVVILLVLAVVAVGCSEIIQENNENGEEFQVSSVYFTPCQQNKLKSSESSSKVDLKFTDEGVQITYYNFEVTCDFSTVNVTHSFVNGFLNITQQGLPNQADCVCYTDVTYTIAGISQDEVNLIFINGEQVYCYNDRDEDKSGVYVAGYEFPDRGIPTEAKLWKNGKVTNLTNNTSYAYATSVYVSDNDVYVAGSRYSNIPHGNTIYLVSYALLWKNGKVQTIGSDFSSATSVFVSNEDVYVTGHEYLIQSSDALKMKSSDFLAFEPNFIYKYQLPIETNISIRSSSLDEPRQGVATIWKNGKAQYLTDGSYLALANSVYVSGSDVYVAGWEYNNQNVSVAKLWKNGKAHNLTDGSYHGSAQSVFVSDNIVYVAGTDGNIATLWKNGVAHRLTNGRSLSSAQSIFVSGDDVYVAGSELNGEEWVAKLWKNGEAQNLTLDGCKSSQAHSVFVSDNDVYVAGFGKQNTQNYDVAKLWKNGELQNLTDGSKNGYAYSVFVK